VCGLANTYVLDPGHGGNDPGCCYNGLQEDDVCLNICRELQQVLESQGHKAILTRDGTEKKKLPFSTRAEVANRIKSTGVVFICIHANAIADHPEACGMEAYYHPVSRYGKKIAENVFNTCRSLYPNSDRSNPLHKRELAVLSLTDCPAIYLEVGFLSNPKEAKLLTEPNWVKSLCKAIAMGLSMPVVVK
jgi:N-acetylmuramoyl-L-alanine amidase